jgi:hypothetical protein
MTCDEFATAGIDLGSAEASGLLQKAAREHLRECPHCAALQENWLSLREDLRGLGAETAGAEAPARVEMRLRQEFLRKHQAVRHRSATILAWSLAAALTFFFAVSGANWYRHRGAAVANVQSNARITGNASQSSAAARSAPSEALVASNDSGDFTLLPDSMPPALEDATVVRVQMQRAALGALGLTVNEEHAADWIQVDLLVGDDGLPQAVRLPQSASGASN